MLGLLLILYFYLIKMSIGKLNLQVTRQCFIENSLQTNSIIQNISRFCGHLYELEELNAAGQLKLNTVRKCIHKLEELAKYVDDINLERDITTYREQFFKMQHNFRSANITAMMEIVKLNREELLLSNNKTVPGNDLDFLKFNSSTHILREISVTEKMLSISRFLSETTQKSALTLETLTLSSQSIDLTRNELSSTQSTIFQSSKLLRKYGRRELTDKMLLFFAFSFFLACAFYIVQKRLI